MQEIHRKWIENGGRFSVQFLSAVFFSYGNTHHMDYKHRMKIVFICDYIFLTHLKFREWYIIFLTPVLTEYLYEGLLKKTVYTLISVVS